MSWILGKVLNNPSLILWIAMASFVIGIVSGGSAAWTIQGWRIDAVQSKFDGFVSTTKALGDAAKIAADKAIAEDKLKKEKADHENATTVANLRAANKRLRDANSSISFLPTASAGSINPQRYCFDRSKLELSLQQLDAGVQGIVEEGDVAVINLNTAKQWAE